MRGSVGRLGSMLLPFNAGRTAAIAARRLAGTAVPGGPLERLHISIQYEARLDYSNAQGRSEAFDVFLQNELAKLQRGGQLPPTVANKALEEARHYRNMPPEKRQQFCTTLEALLNSVQHSTGGGPAPAAAISASLPLPYAPTRPRSRANRHSAVQAVHPVTVQPQQPQQPPPPPPPPQQQQAPAPPLPSMPVAATQQTAEPAPTQQLETNGTVNGAPAANAAFGLQQDVLQAAVAAAGAEQGRDTLAGGGGLAAGLQGMEEWDLSLEQQQQRPFQPPDPSHLLRAVPVIFDLETSDRLPKGRVAEVGALAVGSGETFRQYVSLPPGVKMEAGAAEITGLSTEFLARHPPFEEVYPSFLAFLRRQVQAAGPGAYLLLVGHNIRVFDIKVLASQAAASGLPTLRHARFLDTVFLARALFPGSGAEGDPSLPPNKSLAGLYTFFAGRAPHKSHGALEDCDSNRLVLEQLLLRMPDVPEGGIEALAHAAAWAPGKSWCGWAGDVGSSARGPKQAVPRRKVVSPTSPTTAARSMIDALISGQAAVADLQPHLDLPDPLLEGELGVGEEGSSADRWSRVRALQQGWRAVQEDAQLRQSFLSTPLAELRSTVSFTPRQQDLLQGSGITTLAELLHCFPSRLITSQPGRLPEESDADPVVTLAVRCTRKPYVQQGKGGCFLRASYQVVHPSLAGLDAAWLPPHAYQDTDCNLEVFEFRKLFGPAHRVRWVLQKMADELEAAAGPGSGGVLVLSGPVKLQTSGPYAKPGTWQFEANKWQVLGVEEARAAFCQPHSSAQMRVVHRSRPDLPPKSFASLVAKGLKAAQDGEDKGQLQDLLPEWMRRQYGLQPLLPALRGMHSPGSEEELEGSRQRLAFQELLALQLKLMVQRNMAWEGDGGGGVQVGGSRLLDLCRESLPFELTEGQAAALDDILRQMESWPPMQCLLQGDVGCGKTVVAFLALLAAVGSGYQGAIMAPTEILADQHFRNLQALVQAVNRQAGVTQEPGFRQPRIALVTGSVRGKARALVDEGLARGDIDIAVGTHALISDSTQFACLGLAVVDEQHKFGVEQRGRLLAKASPAPHILHMTATPIPRTQALIDHGNMTQALIQELPAGRSPVITHMLEDGSPERLHMYQHIREEMGRGHGIYIVCPFVETSDKMAEVKAATSELDRLVAEGVFEVQDCGLLHGQMPPEDKDAVLRRFKAGQVKVLVSTTVVEVGVDVPQATVMVIEHAERFGFAQLHQLRGRVGRSHRQSCCYLVYSADAGPGVKRKMKVLVNCNNGFTVAECDLELRGAGEVLGRRQSGRDVKSSFKVAQIPADRELLERARQAATTLLQREPDPRQWPAELRAMLADESLLQLDTLDVDTHQPLTASQL